MSFPVATAYPPEPWAGYDAQSDECILPGLQDLLDSAAQGVGASEPFTSCGPLPDYAGLGVPELSLLNQPLGLPAFSVPATPGLLPNLPVLEVLSAGDGSSGGRPSCTDAGCPEERVKQETGDAEDGRQSSPGASGASSKAAQQAKAGDKAAALLDKKALAKQRYREKNRKAQARHRERNKRTIEDLTARVAALTAENANLKLELSIASKVSRAKDDHYAKLRRAKDNLAYVEAESLLADSCAYAATVDASVTPDSLQGWCLQDSAAIRQAGIQRLATLLQDPTAREPGSAAHQELSAEVASKRQLSLRFAVGKPRFVRSLFAWEREYCKHLPQPDFPELWRRAVAVMAFSQEQRLQLVRARALLLARMRTVLAERAQLVAAAQAGAMEGVADVLASSLEEERQAVFGFLFTFFDETMSVLEECELDAEIYPWAPDVAAIADRVTEDAVAASPTGLEGLGLPPGLLPTADGRLDFDALLRPAAEQLAPLQQRASVAALARAAGTRWPPETPFELLSAPVTSRSCSTSGMSLLRNVLMFAEGVMPVRLPDIPREVLTRIPILKMIRQ